jgi:hypothetical protein
MDRAQAAAKLLVSLGCLLPTPIAAEELVTMRMVTARCVRQAAQMK